MRRNVECIFSRAKREWFEVNITYCVKLLGWYIKALNFFSLLIPVFLNWGTHKLKTNRLLQYLRSQKKRDVGEKATKAGLAKVSFITPRVPKPCKLKPLAPNSLFVWCRWGHQYFILWWQAIMKTKTKISITRNIWILTKLPTFVRWFEC